MQFKKDDVLKIGLALVIPVIFLFLFIAQLKSNNGLVEMEPTIKVRSKLDLPKTAPSTRPLTSLVIAKKQVPFEIETDK